MSTNSPLLIFFSKKKLLRLLFYCLCFIAIGSWMLIAQPETSNRVFNQPIIKYAAAVLSVLMGGVGLIFFSMKLFSSLPAIQLDSLGITDNASAVSAGFISWNDITEIAPTTVSGQKFIRIQVVNPQEYISRQTHVFKKKVMRANLSKYGTPLFFSPNNLNSTFEDLLRELQLRLDSFRSSVS